MAAATSATSAFSSGLWLMPLKHRTKSIATGDTFDTGTASCPAPLTNSTNSIFELVMACFNKSFKPLSQLTGFVSCIKSQSTAILRFVAIDADIF